MTPVRSRSRMLRNIIFLAILSLVIWISGLMLFISHIESLSEPSLTEDTPKTDAIVVLTGGSERLTTGVALLNDHWAKKLFISGVYQGLSTQHILNPQSLDPLLRACCIVLGYAAISTEGNAEETREWMTTENYHSLRLVTANYHMPRSLLLFHRAMPDTLILPYPVTPDSLKLDMWWKHAGTASLLVTEYAKYILSLFRTGFGLT